MCAAEGRRAGLLSAPTDGLAHLRPAPSSSTPRPAHVIPDGPGQGFGRHDTHTWAESGPPRSFVRSAGLHRAVQRVPTLPEERTYMVSADSHRQVRLLAGRQAWV